MAQLAEALLYQSCLACPIAPQFFVPLYQTYRMFSTFKRFDNGIWSFKFISVSCNEWIITVQASISEAPGRRCIQRNFLMCCWWKKSWWFEDSVHNEYCGPCFMADFITDIILSSFVITLIWDHDRGQLSFCLPFFIPDSSHFFPVLVSVISCLSSTFCVVHIYIAFWSLMLLFKSERYSSFFFSSEDFPFFHFFHSFFNISRSDWHGID